MKKNQKKLLFKSIFSLTLLAVFANGTFAQQVSKTLPQPGYYHMQMGNIDIIALSDGSIPQNLNQLLTNVQPGRVKELTGLNFQEPIVEASVNAYLFELGGQLILVDAGTSELYGPSLGHLSASFAKAGFKPEDVDIVLITHIHTDHTGGLMDGGRMVFPNATVYVSKKEYDFWLTPENFTNAPKEMKPYFEQAALKMNPYVKAGKVKTFGYEKEILPGILPVASAGHTPGHSFYKVTSKGNTIVFWGDILHSAAVQFADPNVTIIYDVDPKAAAAARKKAFSDATKGKYWIAADHISFPGIGHIRSAGTNGYRWFPINFTTSGVGQ
jgi:glyoxylase-like metal-dependent hydrolase (beta-lactamase superfamily II)